MNAFRQLVRRLRGRSDRTAPRSQTAARVHERRRSRRGGAWYLSRGRSGLLVLALIGFASLWLALNALGLIRRGPVVEAGAFVVRVAPFTTSGDDARSGTIVAQQLLARLETDVRTPMNIGLLATPITSPQQAFEIAQTNDIDVLIWGEVAAGTTADQAGLRPHLVWRPSNPYVPQTWQGYDGAIVLPADYDLALRELNGPVVLAPLLDGINHFGRGDVDRATAAFERLRRDYGDVLRAELPAMIQAISYWAEGRYAEAEPFARDALRAADRPQHHNTLAVILAKQQQRDAAREQLDQAISAAPTIAQPHANLGRLLLDRGQPEAAIPELQTANRLLPRSLPIQATLGEAYRRAGQLANARTTTNGVLAQDADNGPALAEQSMLSLTDVTTATGLLEWELLGTPVRSAEQLADVRSRAEQGIASIEALRNQFLQQANAYGASGRPDMQRLAETQAAILEQELLNRYYQLTLVQIEQGRVQALQPRSGIRRFWDALTGRDTPLDEAIDTATRALKQEPSLDLQYDYHVQQGRAAYLRNDLDTARTEWTAAQQLIDTAPADSALKTRPEAHYGRALLAVRENQSDPARTELAAALAADQRFFPARQQMATLADQAQNWNAAAPQYLWLATNRPWEAHYRFDLARVQQQQGNLAEAELQLLPLANANNVDAAVMLGAMYRESGRLDAADVALQRALDIAPNSAAVNEELGRVALARNQYQVAEQRLLRAIQLDPNRSSARIALGQLYAGPLRQPQAAAAQFQAAVDNNSTDPLVHRQLGEMLLESGNAAAAATSFRRAIELDGNGHEAHHGLATAYIALGNYDDARKEEQRVLELTNNNYTLALVGLGDIARAKGQDDDAIAQYNAALERDPRLAVAYLGLGQTALAQGRPEIALGHFRKGLELDPRNVQLRLGEADTLMRQNAVADARAAYEQVKQLAPGNATAAAGIGQALYREGKTDEALRALDEAAQLNPNDANSLLTIGEINTELNRPDAALQAFSRAIEVRDDWYEPRFRRGVLLLRLERTPEAINDLEDAVRRNDEFAQGHYWLGRAYRAAGRFGDARKQFDQAVKQQADYFEARYFLGRTLDELGQAPDAISTYEAIVKDAPDGNEWRTEADRELDRIR